MNQSVLVLDVFSQISCVPGNVFISEQIFTFSSSSAHRTTNPQTQVLPQSEPEPFLTQTNRVRLRKKTLERVPVLFSHSRVSADLLQILFLIRKTKRFIFRSDKINMRDFWENIRFNYLSIKMFQPLASLTNFFWF